MLRRMLKTLRHATGGQATIELLVVTPLLLWFMFQSIYGWMVLSKYEQLHSVQQAFLVREQISGELTTADVNAMNQQLASYGFNVSLVRYTGSSPFNVLVTRGNSVTLNVGYPLAQIVPLFWKLNGQNPANVQDSWAVGTAISEAP